MTARAQAARLFARVVDWFYDRGEAGARAYAPHCDPSVLHAPGTCDACDSYPHWQTARQRQRVNFTGKHDPGLAPCPSTWFRDDATRDAWYGNQARSRD